MVGEGHPSICLVSDCGDSSSRNGCDDVLVRDAKALRAAGWTVTIVIACPPGDGGSVIGSVSEHLPGCRVLNVDALLGEASAAEDIPLWAFHFRPYHRSYRIALALKLALSRQHFDIIEFVDRLGLGYVTMKWRRLWGEPFVASRLVVRLRGTHESGWANHPIQSHSREELHTHQMERYCLRHADGWVSPSEAVAAWYRRRHAIAFMPTVVLAPPYRRLGLGRTHRRGLRRPFEVLYFGEPSRRAATNVFVEAAVSVCATLADPVRFRLIGTNGPGSRAALISLVPERWRSRFAFQDKVSPDRILSLSEGATLAVVPGWPETFDPVAYELNWIGIPLVLRRTSASDGVFEDGRNCRFFGDDANEGVDSLAGVLIDILTGESPFRTWTWNAPVAPSEGQITDAYRDILRWAPTSARRTSSATVSVIIPYFNAHATVDDTIKSVLRGGDELHQVIIVDDGSTAPEAVAHFNALRARHAGDERFSFKTKPNGGLSSARNAGLALADGKYVLPLDADDVIEPDYLYLAVMALERNPELVAVSCLVSYFADGQSPDTVIDYVIAYDLDPLLITLENRAGVAGSVFRRSVLSQIGYSENLKAYEDWDLWWSLAERGAMAEVLPRVLYRYRRRQMGLFQQVGVKRHTELLAQIEARHPSLLQTVGVARRQALAVMEDENSRWARLQRRLRDAVVRRWAAFRGTP